MQPAKTHAQGQKRARETLKKKQRIESCLVGKSRDVEGKRSGTCEFPCRSLDQASLASEAEKVSSVNQYKRIHTRKQQNDSAVREE